MVNRGSESTFCGGNKHTVINVTFINTLLCDNVHGWQVMSIDTMSDHRQIQFDIKQDKLLPTKRRNIKNTDWDVYDTELCAKVGMWFGRVNTPDDIERELDVVDTTVLKSFRIASPERKISGRNKKPWWNHDLKVLRQKANHAFYKAYKSGLEQDWQSHRNARWCFKKNFGGANVNFGRTSALE